jgi:zinc D-Ala-D-Ala carboxypeptidase
VNQGRSLEQQEECPERIRSVLASLQISLDSIAARSLVPHPEAAELVVAETGDDGREHLLVPAAARAWQALRGAAASEAVVVRIVSAFRTVDRQAEIVRAKLQSGLSLDAILSVSAPPGYSEHHSGRAVDVTTEGVRPLELEFEGTPAFQWLSDNAERFGFFLSYPRENRYGYAYEPWHWCFKDAKHDEMRRIRRAVASDAGAACRTVRRSIAELCAEDHHGDADTIAEWLANKTEANFESWINSDRLVAMVAEGPAGVIGFGLLGLNGTLALLYVSPDARFQGVSKSLVTALEREAAAAGVREITLGSSLTARRFYERCGYVSAGEPVKGFGRTQSYPMRKGIP